MKTDLPIYIVLGSNIQPFEHIPQAVQRLREVMDVHTVGCTWETPPYGTSGQNFLNVALLAYTNRKPEELKYNLLRPLEAEMGRIRTGDKYAAREIDLDIIVFDDQVLEPKLWSLPFLAIPLADLLPNLTQPETGIKLIDIAKEMLQKNDITPRLDVRL